MKDSGGNFKSPAHRTHHLTKLPPQISGGLRHRYRHHQGQTDSVVSSLEGGGPVRDLPEPAQGA